MNPSNLFRTSMAVLSLALLAAPVFAQTAKPTKKEVAQAAAAGMKAFCGDVAAWQVLPVTPDPQDKVKMAEDTDVDHTWVEHRQSTLRAGVTQLRDFCKSAVDEEKGLPALAKDGAKLDAVFDWDDLIRTVDEVLVRYQGKSASGTIRATSFYRNKFFDLGRKPRTLKRTDQINQMVSDAMNYVPHITDDAAIQKAAAACSRP